MSDARATGRVRRPPPAFRRLAVQSTQALSPRMVRVTLSGPELAGLVVEQPASSVRVFVPTGGRDELVLPTWTGNVFLLDDGSRAPIRTLTPRRVDLDAFELDLDIVLHGAGVIGPWAATAQPGDQAAVSGPARGYVIEPGASAFLLAGDETAIPAISQLLHDIPRTARVQVHIELGAAGVEVELPSHAGAVVEWHVLPAGAPPGDTVVTAVVGEDITPGTKVWVAGEAASVQRVRRYLFEECGMARSEATVRGYWKHGRTGDAADDD